MADEAGSVQPAAAESPEKRPWASLIPSFWQQ
jgi:hypothetical protein